MATHRFMFFWAASLMGCAAHNPPPPGSASVNAQSLFQTMVHSFSPAQVSLLGKSSTSAYFRDLIAGTSDESFTIGSTEFHGVRSQLLKQEADFLALSSQYPTLADMWNAGRLVRPNAVTFDLFQQTLGLEKAPSLGLDGISDVAATRLYSDAYHQDPITTDANGNPTVTTYHGWGPVTATTDTVLADGTITSTFVTRNVDGALVGKPFTLIGHTYNCGDGFAQIQLPRASPDGSVSSPYQIPIATVPHPGNNYPTTNCRAMPKKPEKVEAQ